MNARTRTDDTDARPYPIRHRRTGERVPINEHPYWASKTTDPRAWNNFCYAQAQKTPSIPTHNGATAPGEECLACGEERPEGGWSA